MGRPRTTRRQFLQVSALALAGTTVPHLGMGCVTAAESQKRKLTVAAIGVGGRGSDIGRQAAALGRMVACADVHRGNAERFAGKLGNKCEVFGDYRKILDMKEVEAVTIGTPDHWHVKIACDALKAGKDVYCEKPLTLTIAEGEVICGVVKESGRVMQVGTQQRSEFGNGFLEAVAIARSGKLGTKLKAQASVGGGRSGGPFKVQEPPKQLDWDFWLGQAPKVPFTPERCGGNFRWWFDYSGGQVTDWGVHHTDIALWALGGETTGPAEVEGKGVFPLGRELIRDYLLGKRPLEDLPNSFNVARGFDCTMTLPNGNQILLDSHGNDLLIEGSEGHIAVNRGGIRGKFVDDLKKEPAGRAWLAEEVAKLYKGKPIRGHMAHFFDCVADRSLPVSDVYTHVNSVNACHMANIAMLLERKIRWDTVKRQFVDDADATALMHRKQRPEYRLADR